jgi:dUTP pyrophosphatase
MFEKINEFREQMKMIKNLQSSLNDIDMSDTNKMMESMGIDMDMIEETFKQSVANNISRKVDLKYKNESENKDPEYAYESDSGFDLRATEDVWVFANNRKLIPTGIRFDIPEGFEIQVRSKSGLALNQGLMVLNSPGTVDSGYQGEVKVIIFNTTNENIKIEKGQKIAQAVLCPVVTGGLVNLIKVEKIGEKDRNDKGFGSTGI